MGGSISIPRGQEAGRKSGLGALILGVCTEPGRKDWEVADGKSKSQ